MTAANNDDISSGARVKPKTETKPSTAAATDFGAKKSEFGGKKSSADFGAKTGKKRGNTTPRGGGGGGASSSVSADPSPRAATGQQEQSNEQQQMSEEEKFPPIASCDSEPSTSQE